jgi:hypothetical protein
MDNSFTHILCVKVWSPHLQMTSNYGNILSIIKNHIVDTNMHFVSESVETSLNWKIKQFEKPIISTSVHDKEDEVLQYMTDPDEMFERYEKLVDIVIDGGAGTRDASTIINASNDEIEIVRQGLFPYEGS